MCTRSYGLFPCSDDIGGAFFMILVYGFLMLKGANFLSDGSEMLLEIVDPGVIGGLLLPLLGALPDSLIILSTGLGSRSEAIQQIDVGMGTLAGSTIMLLTLTWGLSVLVGRCDFDEKNRAIDKQLSKQCDLVNTGVTTDRGTPINAAIMMGTVLFFMTIQIPAWTTQDRDPQVIKWASLAGTIVCFIALLAYSVYQVVQPDLQRRRIEAARLKRHRYETLSKLVERAQTYGGLVDENGNLRSEQIDRLFDAWDINKNGFISGDELRGMLLGLNMTCSYGDELDVQTMYFMKEFDQDSSKDISKDELAHGLEKWIKEKQNSYKRLTKTRVTLSTEQEQNKALQEPLISEVEEGLIEEYIHNVEEVEEDELEGESKGQLSPRALATIAVIYLFLGTLLCAVFSDPLVNSMSNFANALNINAFYVAFVISPFASNASEFISSLQFAAKKRSKNISLTFSQVYGAVTMNNTLGLGLFLVLIFYHDLEWNFTSEVVSVILITFMIGVLGFLKLTFRSYMGVLVLALYPLAILFVYILDEALGLQ